MKLWHKVFLGTFILFELLFNASSFYLIEHHFNQNQQNEIARGLTEQSIIQSQIQSDWSYVNSLNQQLALSGSASDFLKNNTEKYTRFFDAGHVTLQTFDEKDNLVSGNFTGDMTGARPELNDLSAGNRRYVIRDAGGNTYLFVAGSLPLGDTPYKLCYIRDISGIYGDRSAQIQLFFKMNIAITVLLAAGLYALIWFLTRSVRSLNRTAQIIAGGDYTQRVQVLSNDEIGVLAQSFNQMAGAIEGTVRELEATAKSKQNFIDCLTHELKTPLTSIIGYAEFLRAAKFNEEVFFKALNYIHSEGRRLESLSFKLMDLILVGKGAHDMKREDVTLLFSDIEESMTPLLERHQITLQIEAENHDMPMERDLIILLCTNLLDNAIKASKPGGRIFLRGYTTADHAYAIEVKDEGIGIPEADIPKIFEPFFVVDKARSRASHGAGLGLAICAEIVRLHEGRIDVESRVNEGTKVTVVFPR